MDLGLTGKTALVTGGSKGIGRAVAHSLAAEGARVMICSRDAGALAQTAGDIERATGGRVETIAADLSRHSEVGRVANDAVTRLGRLDILVNNAGIGAFGPVAEMTPEIWDAVIETNLNSLFYCTHAALPHLRKTGDAFIVNIGSLAGKNPFANGAAYNASKFGLIGFSEALMQEVRYDGIRVAYIMPGSVATEFNQHHPGLDDAWRIQPEDVARAVLDTLSYPARSLTSRIEMRPSQPPRK
jgi:NAD(P)-dependent dehydrogenase (short-subunit alcohol dehydrogenase family)